MPRVWWTVIRLKSSLADSLEHAFDLLLLIKKLAFVIDVLQLAAAALLVDRARRVRTKAAFFFQIDEAAEGEAFLTRVTLICAFSSGSAFGTKIGKPSTLATPAPSCVKSSNTTL